MEISWFQFNNLALMLGWMCFAFNVREMPIANFVYARFIMVKEEKSIGVSGLR